MKNRKEKSFPKPPVSQIKIMRNLTAKNLEVNKNATVNHAIYPDQQNNFFQEKKEIFDQII